MKILINLYKILNYGGIGNYVENLTLGFQELGHSVELILIATTDREPYSKQHSKRPGNSPSVFKGMTVNPDTGWGGVKVWSYSSSSRVSKLKEYFKTFDCVIWALPVPSYTELPKTPFWKDLYTSGVPQIAIIHDGNFRYLYPHLNLVAEHLEGVACVHGAAFGSAKLFDGKYALIPNPHELLSIEDSPSWDERKNMSVCAHMWKGWKHMHYAVAAAPFLKSSKLILAGDGIERRYMTSPTKTPENYKGLWSAAMDSGKARWLDILPTKRLHEIYNKSRVMLDCSFSKNYNLLGSHFNRSVFESYNTGVVPLLIKENMVLPELFKEGETHFEVPSDCTPKELAKKMDFVANLDSDTANHIVSNGRSLLKKYCTNKKVARSMLNLCFGEGPTGVFGSEEFVGRSTKLIREAALYVEGGGRPKNRCFTKEEILSKEKRRALL